MSAEHQAAGCMCRDVPIGSHLTSVLMELPEHMTSVRGARLRDGLSPYITVDSCLVEEIRDLWSKGITTTGCCCGHNRAQGFIGVASQDIHAMKAMGYLVAPNASRPGDENSFVPKSIRSEPQASNAGADDCSELVRILDEMYAPVHAALSTPEPQTGERDGEVERLTRENDRLTNANASLINDTVQMGMARDDAERLLAEVEERAREALSRPTMERRLLTMVENYKAGHSWDSSDEETARQSAWEIAHLRAALRAKPEAQAIVGKEGDQ